MDHHDNPSDNDEGQVYQTETFVFTGNGGPALLATMQNFMNRMMHGQQQQQQQQQQPAQSEQSEQPEEHIHPEQSRHDHSEDTDMSTADDPPVPELPSANDEGMPPLEPLSGDGAPPESRPIRPLPRPHAHFHAHTAGGIIDLFTFNIAGPPPPPPPGAATLTFNFGPDVFAGFEAFFLGGMQKDREPDPERAKVLMRGMEVVPEGLVRRLERAGGVPGREGSEDGAGCAVCWGPLLDEVDPSEWETAKEKEDRAKMADDDKHGDDDDTETHGRVVALPCAHVYHADCLLPWFSRNTTCPMCRFDVDPESLTWTPRPPAAEPPPPPHPGNDIPPENPSEAPLPPPGAGDPPNGPADQNQPTDAAQVARFTALLTSILRATPIPQQQLHHPVPQPQHQEQQPQLPPQSIPQPQSLPQPQNLNEPPIFGPMPPLPPPPNSFVLPPLFRMPMPLFIVPQPNAARDNPNSPSPPPPPPPALHVPNSPPSIRPQLQPLQPLAFHWSPEDPHTQPPQTHTLPTSPPPPPRRERKKWTPPEPVGKTLRQRVEEKERELGLRCDDMVCGVAPSDEDPTPIALQSASGTKRITIRAAYDAHGKACQHSFHPACLVTSARVAGVTGDETGRQQEEEEEVAQDDGLQVACPVCRAVGSLSREEWNEGVQASEAEMA